MSALDKLRSFAEAREGNDVPIRDGLTYGDARDLVELICALHAYVDLASRLQADPPIPQSPNAAIPSLRKAVQMRHVSAPAVDPDAPMPGRREFRNRHSACGRPFQKFDDEPQCACYVPPDPDTPIPGRRVLEFRCWQCDDPGEIDRYGYPRDWAWCPVRRCTAAGEEDVAYPLCPKCQRTRDQE